MSKLVATMSEDEVAEALIDMIEQVYEECGDIPAWAARARAISRLGLLEVAA